MIRSIALVSAGTLGSRLTGFIRDAMVAALLGAGAIADAFLVAFQLVTLVRRLLTEGALNAALVPAWLRVRKAHGEKAASQFGGRALGTIALIVALAAAGLALVAPSIVAWLAPGFAARGSLEFAVTATRLMLPYLAFAGPVAVLIALANAQRRVAFTAAAPVLFNVALIGVMALLLLTTMDAARAAWIVAATVGIAGLLQLAMLSGARTGASPVRVSLDAEMRALLGRAAPGMIASAGPQMLIVSGAIVASREPSGVAWLYFASRLIDLPLGIVSTVSGAVLVTEAAHARDDDTARTAQSHAIGVAIGLALPAAVGLFLLAEPIVRVVFTRGAFTVQDAAATARALEMLALGLPTQALAKALAPSFYARGDTLTPMAAALAGLAVALIAATFSPDVAAIAAAISLGGAISAAILLARAGVMTMRGAALIPIALACAAMGTALSYARNLLPFASGIQGAPPLVALIAAGLAIYVAALFAFGVRRPMQIRTAWRRRDLHTETLRGTGTPDQNVQDTNK